MIERKKVKGEKAPAYGAWLVYALFSAVFASLTAILGKIGIQGVESNLGTAIRTGVVLIMAWVVVFVVKKQGDIRKIDRKSWLFIILSGFATGGSWLCYYRALQDGPASIVVPIDKLSTVLTVAFAYFFLKEKLTRKSLGGLALIVAGTLALLV
ncbi:MAG: EamA family transporter [Anaerolineaceae bacterium]|nr:EamA family transporter [Anaerolineaceae bacterium]